MKNITKATINKAVKTSFKDFTVEREGLSFYVYNYDYNLVASLKLDDDKKAINNIVVQNNSFEGFSLPMFLGLAGLLNDIDGTIHHNGNMAFKKDARRFLKDIKIRLDKEQDEIEKEKVEDFMKIVESKEYKEITIEHKGDFEVVINIFITDNLKYTIENNNTRHCFCNIITFTDYKMVGVCNIWGTILETALEYREQQNKNASLNKLILEDIETVKETVNTLLVSNSDFAATDAFESIATIFGGWIDLDLIRSILETPEDIETTLIDTFNGQCLLIANSNKELDQLVEVNHQAYDVILELLKYVDQYKKQERRFWVNPEIVKEQMRELRIAMPYLELIKEYDVIYAYATNEEGRNHIMSFLLNNEGLIYEIVTNSRTSIYTLQTVLNFWNQDYFTSDRVVNLYINEQMQKKTTRKFEAMIINRNDQEVIHQSKSINELIERLWDLETDRTIRHYQLHESIIKGEAETVFEEICNGTGLDEKINYSWDLYDTTCQTINNHFKQQLETYDCIIEILTEDNQGKREDMINENVQDMLSCYSLSYPDIDINDAYDNLYTFYNGIIYEVKELMIEFIEMVNNDESFIYNEGDFDKLLERLEENA